MAGTGVGKFSSTASNNTSNLTVNFAENMAPSNVNNAARELMGHMRDMYEQLGDGYFEFGDGDGTYTVARGDADTITITSSADISGIYFAGRKIRITDGGANVVEGTIASSSHSSTTQTVNLTGISLASGTPTKVELGIDTAAFGGRIILDDDGDTYIEAPTDDTIDIYVAGAKDFVITANTFTAESGSTIAAQALTATTGAFTNQVTISTAGVDPQLQLISTEAGATQAPILDLYRNSSSPADADVLGQINYYGENSADEKIDYVRIRAFIEDVTDGDEASGYSITTYTAGSQFGRMNIDETVTVFNENSADVDFRVESNGNANMLFVDSGNDHVNIGTSSDLGGVLNVNGQTVILTTDNSDTLTLVSTDADASVGPNLRLYRSSSSPADDDTTGAINFIGRNDNSQDVTYASIRSFAVDVSDGSEDGLIAISIPVNGTSKDFVKMGINETVFNEDSADLNFRVESNGNANMLFVDGGNDKVGIGNAAPANTLDISDTAATDKTLRLGQSSGTANASATIKIASGGTGNAMLRFDYESNEDRARIGVTTSGQALQFFTAGDNERMRILAGGQISTGGEDNPDPGSGGLCLQQGAIDSSIMTFKSSDVAHGITNTAETDTYGFFQKVNGASGGLKMFGFSEGESALQIDADYTTDNTTKGTGATCPLQFNIRKKDGTGTGSPGADANMFSVTNNGQTKFIVDEDGDIHNDGSVTAYDNYEDAQLVRAFDLSHGKGVIDSKFDKFISYNHEALADMKLVGREEDGTPNHFVNVTGMQRLHNGAIWQQYEKTEKLANAVYELAKAAVGEEKANEILEQNEIKLLN